MKFSSSEISCMA